MLFDKTFTRKGDVLQKINLWWKLSLAHHYLFSFFTVMENHGHSAGTTFIPYPSLRLGMASSGQWNVTPRSFPM